MPDSLQAAGSGAGTGGGGAAPKAEPFADLAPSYILAFLKLLFAARYGLNPDPSTHLRLHPCTQSTSSYDRVHQDRARLVLATWERWNERLGKDATNKVSTYVDSVN